MTIPHQAKDSSELGYIQSTPPPPTPGQIPAGQTLENYLQQMVAGISGLEETMVRPRWQPDPPNLPDYGVSWCSTGIMRTRRIGIYAAVIRHPLGNGGDGYDEMQRHEEFDLAASFYGFGAEYYSGNLIDGLMLWQNKVELHLVGMVFVEVQDPIISPELIRERWWPRVDLFVTMRRIIRRNYPVLNLLEAAFQVRTETGYVVTKTSAEVGGGPILPPPYSPPEIGGGPRPPLIP